MIRQGPGRVELFVCLLLRIKTLDFHLKGKYVNALPDIKLGKLGKMFISKQVVRKVVRWGWSVKWYMGVVRKVVRGGGPRTWGQCFIVSP